MKPLAECLDLIQGKSPDEFVQGHPHSVLIGLGAIGGELQRNPTKAAGTMFLNLSSGPGDGDSGTLVNYVFGIQKVSNVCPPDGIYVGSATDNDIVIPDSSISKSHAHIVLTTEGSFLVDHGSTNGSFTNGTKVQSAAPVLLRGGDIVTMGRFSFTYYDAMSFAKLLYVQAMARGRKANSPRTPGAAGMKPPGAKPFPLTGTGPRSFETPVSTQVPPGQLPPRQVSSPAVHLQAATSGPQPVGVPKPASSLPVPPALEGPTSAPPARIPDRRWARFVAWLRALLKR